MTTIDLGALDAFQHLSRQHEPGRPLSIDLDRIHPDPGQPRKAFAQDGLNGLADSIREAGVKVPVSVRPHPNLPDAFMLNHGERRWRAAQIAGLIEIPAFIEERFTDFDQVIENLQREDLTPMELALFLDSKVRAGAKKGDIARKLGIHIAEVTRLLALIEAPAILDAVYRSGRCTSPLTLYNLRALYDKAPLAVEAWIESGVEITRRGVDDLRRELSAQPEMGSAFDHDQMPASSASTSPTPSACGRSAGRPSHALVIPVLHVQIAGRGASVCLDREPSGDGVMFVLWSDTGAAEEVAVEVCQLVGLSFPPKASGRRRRAPQARRQPSDEGKSPPESSDEKG